MTDQTYLLAIALVLIHAAAADETPITYDRTTKNRSGLKASDVCLSCRMLHKDRPPTEAVEAWQPTRLEWSYINDPAFIRFVQEHDALFVGTLNTISGEGPDYDAERFDGTRMVAPWMTGFNDRGGPGWNTVVKPAVLTYQVAALKRFADQGVFTFQHDDWLFNLSSYLWGGGDFSEPTLAAFAAYLESHAPESLRESAGVESWQDFNYRDYLQRTFGWTTVEEVKQQRGSDPLNVYWRRFHQNCSRTYFERLLAEAEAVAGRPVHVTVNANMLHLADCFILDLVDYLVGETRIAGEKEEADLVYMLKLADALCLPQVVSPFPKDEIDVAAVRRTIALTYALGHRLLIPWDVWPGPGKPRWFGTVEEYGDLYRFVREHPDLFDGYRAYADVALLIPLTSDRAVASDTARLTTEVTRLLLARGIPCRYAACGEVAHSIRVPLAPDDLRGMAAVWVCGNTDDLPEADTALLEELSASAPLIRETDAGAIANHLVEFVGSPTFETSSPQLLAFPRLRNKDDPLVVHLVNRGPTIENGFVFLADRLLDGHAPTSVRMVSPGGGETELPVHPAPGGIRIELPHLGLWGVLVL